MNSPYEHVEEIMQSFNFDFLHRQLVALKWEWINAEGSDVPSIDELKQRANRLLLDVASGKTDYTATGGFVAEKVGPVARPYLRLSFCIEDWDTDYLALR